MVESDHISSPSTMGWWRPVILLPAASWRDGDDEQLQVVLAHELAHIHRHDFALGLVGHFCLAIHFYHPLVHWLVSRMQLDQELRADSKAAEVNGGPRRYLEVLARMVLDHDNRSLG
jgi:beta-lactamase regulating signal transducer with metallopeptidase domain